MQECFASVPARKQASGRQSITRPDPRGWPGQL